MRSACRITQATIQTPSQYYYCLLLFHGDSGYITHLSVTLYRVSHLLPNPAGWRTAAPCRNNYVHYRHTLQTCTTDTFLFIADLIACSTCFGHHHAHHQELKSIIQWLLRVVFCAVVFSSSWSGVELRVMCPVCRMLV